MTHEREPGWFPLIARAATPQALLTLRYKVGAFCNEFHMRRLADDEDKVAAGVNPAARATLV